MAFYSLPSGKLHSKKVERLKKIPAGHENRFYKDLGDPFDESFDLNFQHEIISDAPSNKQFW